MRRSVFTYLTALVVVGSSGLATAQKFIPKTIQFQGDSEYSTDELLQAAGLKKGVVLSYSDMQDYSKRLLGSGVFASVAFKFDGLDLTFMLVPSSDLCTVRLENIPLVPGPDLDAKIHSQVPLYHGKVPNEGGINDDVRAALEKLLAAEGLEASIAANTASDLASHKVDAVDYSITTPQVAVAITKIDGISAEFQPKVQTVAAASAKNSFNTTDSAPNLERVIEQFYSDQGYAAAKVQVTQAGAPTLQSGTIVVPFSIQVQEGRVYQVAAIHLPTGTPVTQEEIDKALAPTTSGQAIGVRVRTIWSEIAQRYRTKGNLECKVTPHAVFDDANATVSYNVDVDPGPVYHLAFVKFDNVTDEMRKLLIHNWEMMPGDAFDESYVATFILKMQQQDPVLRRSLAGVKVSYNVVANPDTHDVNVVIRLER
jgi:outer membrane protein assembly factor BamA